MANKTATALLGVGAFSLALGVLVPLMVTPALLKAPGEIDLTTHSRSQAEVLNKDTMQMETKEVDLTRKLSTGLGRFAKDDKFVGNEDVAVYYETLVLSVVGDDGQPIDFKEGAEPTPENFIGLKASESVVAFDRKTGEAVPDYPAVKDLKDKDGNKVHVWKFKTSGEDVPFQTVKFPFGTKTEGADGKGTYLLYDQPTRKAWPVKYTRTTEVKGLEVYEFKGDIPTYQASGQFGALVGTQELLKNNGRTILVEPVTGSIVSSTTSPQAKYTQLLGDPQPTLKVEELKPTDATISERVDAAKEAKSKAVNLQRAPWVLGVLGVLLLVAGVLLMFRRKDDNGAGSGAPAQRSEPVGLSKSKH